MVPPNIRIRTDAFNVVNEVYSELSYYHSPSQLTSYLHTNSLRSFTNPSLSINLNSYYSSCALLLFYGISSTIVYQYLHMIFLISIILIFSRNDALRKSNQMIRLKSPLQPSPKIDGIRKDLVLIS